MKVSSNKIVLNINNTVVTDDKVIAKNFSMFFSGVGDNDGVGNLSKESFQVNQSSMYLDF